jgi:hypothetical protein
MLLQNKSPKKKKKEQKNLDPAYIMEKLNLWLRLKHPHNYFQQSSSRSNRTSLSVNNDVSTENFSAKISLINNFFGII